MDYCLWMWISEGASGGFNIIFIALNITAQITQKVLCLIRIFTDTSEGGYVGLFYHGSQFLVSLVVSGGSEKSHENGIISTRNTNFFV